MSAYATPPEPAATLHAYSVRDGIYACSATGLAAAVAAGEPVVPMTDDELTDHTAELIDELYAPLVVCGLTYPAGQALRRLDPVAMRCIVLDETDSMVREGAWTEIDGGTVRCGFDISA